MTTVEIGMTLGILLLNVFIGFCNAGPITETIESSTGTIIVDSTISSGELVQFEHSDLSATDETTVDPESMHIENRFEVAHFHWPGVRLEFAIVLWILVASIAKMVFNLSKRFSQIFPDSALLIALGLVAGALLHYTQLMEPKWFHLDAHIFFIYLLPPIIFDAGYSMPVRALFENMFSIMTFAVFGTIWNMICMGSALYLFSRLGWYAQEMELLHLLTFTAIISAVDPVAVIAVFEQVHVNEILYINVFGESLLNDAVAVVLYRMCLAYTEIGPNNLIAIDYVFGFASFFIVAFGGTLIGIIAALICSFVTRFSENVSVLNAAFAFLIPYLAYIIAEMVGFSAIMAMLFCGIIMKPYLKENLSFNSTISMKYFTKMLAALCETVVFLFLGLSTITAAHDWDTHFVVLAVIFCVLSRFIGVAILCAILNRYRMHKFSTVDQFVMGYGGLRGAIAYGLVESLPDNFPSKSTYITASIAIILFTVFVQGATIRPIVNCLKVERDEERDKTMSEYTLERLLDHTMAGMESICHHRGHNYIRDVFNNLNNKWLRPMLVRQSHTKKLIDPKLLRAHTKITVNDAIEMVRGEKSKVLAVKRKLEAKQLNLVDTKPAMLDVCDIEHLLRKRSFIYSRDPERSVSSSGLDHDDIRILNSLGLRNVFYGNPAYQSDEHGIDQNNKEKRKISPATTCEEKKAQSL